MRTPVIHRVTALDLKVKPWTWPLAAERRAAIEAHFAEQKRRQPALWNGRVLLGRNAAFAAGRFNADYFETDFASFLSWRDWGFPDGEVFNGFGMGALRGHDGVFALGEMGAHTSNAGRVYFPSGTPDLDDVTGDTLDIAGSIFREVEEETGLTPSEYRAEPVWDCVFTGVAVAVIQILHVDMTGEALRDRIEANLARQSEPELARIHLVRDVRDLTAAMPRFVTTFLESQFSADKG